MNWLIKKLRYSRVLMAQKELQWDVEKADSRRCGRILLLAQQLRMNLIDDTGIPPEFFYSKSGYSDEYIQSFIDLIENNILDAEKITNQTVKRLKKIGSSGKEIKEQHVITRRSLQLWVITLGIDSSKSEIPRFIWNKLQLGLDLIPLLL